MPSEIYVSVSATFVSNIATVKLRLLAATEGTVHEDEIKRRLTPTPHEAKTMRAAYQTAEEAQAGYDLGKDIAVFGTSRQGVQAMRSAERERWVRIMCLAHLSADGKVMVPESQADLFISSIDSRIQTMLEL